MLGQRGYHPSPSDRDKIKMFDELFGVARDGGARKLRGGAGFVLREKICTSPPNVRRPWPPGRSSGWPERVAGVVTGSGGCEASHPKYLLSARRPPPLHVACRPSSQDCDTDLNCCIWSIFVTPSPPKAQNAQSEICFCLAHRAQHRRFEIAAQQSKYFRSPMSTREGDARNQRRWVWRNGWQ